MSTGNGPLVASDQLSDDFIQHFRDKIFPLIDAWSRREFPKPQPSSCLLGDDKNTDPFQVSHAVQGAFVSALDHLDALRALIQDAGVVHARAPTTLLRAALESAATAVWMLEPVSRRERVTRRLRLHWRDLHYRRQAAKVLEMPDDTAAGQERVLEVAAKYGIKPGEVKESLSYAKIVAAASESSRTSSPAPYAEYIWQLCSGIAHAQFWAVLGFLDARESEGGSAETVTLHLTPSETVLETAASATATMMSDAWELLDETCKPYSHRMQDERRGR